MREIVGWIAVWVAMDVTEQPYLSGIGEHHDWSADICDAYIFTSLAEAESECKDYIEDEVVELQEIHVEWKDVSAELNV